LKTLVIGNGGREHALVWKLSQSPLVSELYCAPGSPGTKALASSVPIGADRIDELLEFAVHEKIDLTVVGPEVPLAAGIVDLFQERGLLIYGPSRFAAQLESSKVFSKEAMLRWGIPTAASEVASSAEELRLAAQKVGLPLVLKADGLAAGKGVLIAKTEVELQAGSETFFSQRRFGSSGDRVLVEPFLEGEEVSYMALSDGQRVLPLVTSKDYKRIGDNDTGPNTGGMGSHSPSGIMSSEQESEILETVVRPAVDGLAAEGHPLVGVVYAGLMLTSDGPQTLEFNIRFGDPEAQVLLLRLETDLAEVLRNGAAGDFGIDDLRFSDRAAACIVLANDGYPDSPAKGDAISGLEQAGALDDVVVFHAGTAEEDGRVIAIGGRVLNVCALGDDLEDALAKAYAAADLISWEHKVMRRDIGRRVVGA
jgi:phosphoribosylamine--glycine ligase